MFQMGAVTANAVRKVSMYDLMKRLLLIYSLAIVMPALVILGLSILSELLI